MLLLSGIHKDDLFDKAFSLVHFQFPYQHFQFPYQIGVSSSTSLPGVSCPSL